jgi:glycerol kinase
MQKYILALDQGTSSSRAILFDQNQQMIALAQKEFTQFYPQAGWVEHNPLEIWQTQIDVAFEVIEKAHISAQQIHAIGITNQRETSILWDKSTGKPVYNAIVWQDKRTSDFCELLKEEGLEKSINQLTGLVIDSYFSATKIRWILQNVPKAKEVFLAGNLIFGTVDTWLLWNLTGRKVHATDYSNASRTLLFNINDLVWDEDLLNIFSVDKSILPEVKESSTIFGYSNRELFGVEIPIGGMAGDQQAALFGQTCFEPGMAKNTYGTGCFLLMNTGTKRKYSNSGLVTTIAWGLNGKVEYAQEGSVFIAGAAIKWLRDGLHLIHSAAETEEIALDVESTEGVYVVPAFVGLGAPYWDMYARGGIMGLTQGVTDKHIIRATLESLAYQTRDLVDAMEKDSGIRLQSLNVDGGAVANNYLMQFQSDILNTTVIRPQNTETTALGAAFLAGLSTVFWSKEELVNNRKLDREFVPNLPETMRAQLYHGWQKAVERTRNWIDN